MTAIVSRTRACATCYEAGIERLCAGSPVTARDGRLLAAVPPLPAPLAARVRQAARAILAERGTSWAAETARHPHHHAAA